MFLSLILASAALMGGMFAGGLLIVIISIHRSDRGRFLTAPPADRTEAFTRRLLTGARCSVQRDWADGGQP